jgi:uncharacterized membrane protein
MWFYAAMARGLVSLVVPLAAMIGAAIPAAYSLATGERPGLVPIIGMVIALAAISVVSLAPGRGSDSLLHDGGSVFVMAIGAGILFGAFFLFLSFASNDAGVWAAPIARVGSTTVLVGLALTLARTVRLPRHALLPTATIAVLEVAAVVALVLALQRGPVSVATVLVSLYPVGTVGLAAVILRERLSRPQLAGVALALVAVVLIATG